LSGALVTPYRRLSCALSAESESGRDRRPADSGRGQSLGLLFYLSLEFVAPFDEFA
jgi:hypothetical protein